MDPLSPPILKTEKPWLVGNSSILGRESSTKPGDLLTKPCLSRVFFRGPTESFEVPQAFRRDQLHVREEPHGGVG